MASADGCHDNGEERDEPCDDVQQRRVRRRRRGTERAHADAAALMAVEEEIVDFFWG